MTRPERDYDEILSRVLHSTLDPIEPAGDGLSKIQKRIAEPWLKRQWSLLLNEFTALGWLILVRCEPFFNEARSRLAAFAVSSGRRLRSAALVLSAALARAVARAASWRHPDAADDDGLASVLRRWLGPTMTWLRPALAVAGAVVIVVAGVFTLSNFRTTFFNTAAPANPSSVAGSSHGGSSNHHGSYGSGHSSTQPTSPYGPGTSSSREPATQPRGGRNSTAPPSPCSSSPGATPTPSPTATPTPSPSPSPTATPTPSPSSSATPSGGPGTSPGGAASQLTDDADASCTPRSGTGPAGPS